MTALGDVLGLERSARAVIICADDLGLCHAANEAVFDALRTGIATSAGLMVPAPWAREAAARYRGEDVGVHLTLTAEHELYRWGPVTQSPSLLGGDGGFASTPDDVFDHADLDEVRRECRAQIERAILWGFSVSHLSAHDAVVLERPAFFDIAVDLALEFNLPLRMAGPERDAQLGFPARALAHDAGVLSTNDLRSLPDPDQRVSLDEFCASLSEGVTELTFNPALDSRELRSFADDWAGKVLDVENCKVGGALDRALDHAGIIRLGWSDVKAALDRRG